MKKKKLTKLNLNKKVVSNLNLNSIKGGDMPRSDPSTYKCDTDLQCQTVDPLPIPTCGCPMTQEPCMHDTYWACDTATV